MVNICRKYSKNPIKLQAQIEFSQENHAFSHFFRVRTHIPRYGTYKEKKRKTINTIITMASALFFQTT